MQQFTAAAIFLFCAVTAGFVGNFPPIPNNEIAQTQSCVDNRRLRSTYAYDFAETAPSAEVVKRSKASV
jgi:hypothetical protein